MGMVTRAKTRRLEEEQRLTDRISSLPDGVLGDIVSLLPTKDGARTQILSSRWRHIWRSAPLNIDVNLHEPERRIPVDEIARVLSAHPGPGRRFSISKECLDWLCTDRRTATMDGWLRSPALDNLQELEFGLNNRYCGWSSPRIRLAPLPASVHRFSSSLRVASLCSFTLSDGNDARALHLPFLEQMTLLDAKISDAALRALLDGCPVLRSLLLLDNYGFSQLQIVSPSLRSIGVRTCLRAPVCSQRFIVVDTPCLERLLISEETFGENFLSLWSHHVSVISAPRLCILGKLFDNTPWLEFRKTFFQGSTAMSTMKAVHSVKVLALSEVHLSLDAAIDILKFFPHLEKLYIKATYVYTENVSYRYQELIGTLDIRLRKIVLANYQGIESQINFAKLFVSNARVLKSMIFELGYMNVSEAWIVGQRRLLDVKKRASRSARFTFVSRKILTGSLDLLHAEQVHDLSIDPFERFH